MVGALMKLIGKSMEDILEEYVTYSQPKSRDLDKKFLEDFDPSELFSYLNLLSTPLAPDCESLVDFSRCESPTLRFRL